MVCVICSIRFRSSRRSVQRVVDLSIHLEDVLLLASMTQARRSCFERRRGRSGVISVLKLTERRLEVDRTWAPHDQLFLAGHWGRGGLSGGRNRASQQRGSGAYVDHERSARDALVHEGLHDVRAVAPCWVISERVSGPGWRDSTCALRHGQGPRHQVSGPG